MPPSLAAHERQALEELLLDARAAGFLGPGPVHPHIDHALGYIDVVRGLPGACVDLGSGGGVPALPLALAWPASTWHLVEAHARKAGFLERAIESLGLAARMRVVHGRAEEVGRDGSLRARADLVVARGFGPPAVVAECAAPLLRVGGHLVVSEPPHPDDTRWPVAGLDLLGLAPDPAPDGDQHSYRSLVQATICADRYPRRVGVPAKRPLW